MSATTEDRRTIRVPDPLWDTAKSKAEQDGTTISQVIRQHLNTYTQENKS